MRTGLASKPSFVAVARPWRCVQSAATRRANRGRRGDRRRSRGSRPRFGLHDAVAVGPVGDAWRLGCGNVDFTDADRDGTDVTQTFRVLSPGSTKRRLAHDPDPVEQPAVARVSGRATRGRRSRRRRRSRPSRSRARRSRARRCARCRSRTPCGSCRRRPSSGSVAPITSRFFAIAFSPSSTWTTTGPSVMNLTRSAKNGRSRWTA